MFLVIGNVAAVLAAGGGDDWLEPPSSQDRVDCMLGQTELMGAVESSTRLWIVVKAAVCRTRADFDGKNGDDG